MKKLLFVVMVVLLWVSTACATIDITGKAQFGDWTVLTLHDRSGGTFVRMVTTSKKYPQALLTLTLLREGAELTYVHRGVRAEHAPFGCHLAFKVDDLPWRTVEALATTQVIDGVVHEGALILNWNYSFIQHMQHGQTAWIRYAGDEGHDEYIPFSLVGFTKAYLYLMQRSWDIFGPAWPGNHRPDVANF